MEFILSCTTSKKTPDEVAKEANYSSIDCQYPGSALALDHRFNVKAEVLKNNGFSGDLEEGSIKRRKKSTYITI